MLDLDRLNDHSRQFARLLFARWPEWFQHARFDPYEDFEKEALLVEVPSPVDGSSHGLFITTSEWEVSVGYGEDFHTRFGAADEDGSASFFDMALEFIDDFVAERCVLATAYDQREWLGSWKIDLRQDDLDLVKTEPGVVVKIRSWRGTHNRELTP